MLRAVYRCILLIIIITRVTSTAVEVEAILYPHYNIYRGTNIIVRQNPIMTTNLHAVIIVSNNLVMIYLMSVCYHNNILCSVPKRWSVLSREKFVPASTYTCFWSCFEFLVNLVLLLKHWISEIPTELKIFPKIQKLIDP